jgi:hypothetical protein
MGVYSDEEELTLSRNINRTTDFVVPKIPIQFKIFRCITLKAEFSVQQASAKS